MKDELEKMFEFGVICKHDDKYLCEHRIDWIIENYGKKENLPPKDENIESKVWTEVVVAYTSASNAILSHKAIAWSDAVLEAYIKRFKK